MTKTNINMRFIFLFEQTVKFLLCSAVVLLPLFSIAAPITFNTALPVAKNALVNREQFIVKRFNSDLSPLNRELKVNGLVSVLGYGVTPKLAVFAALPYVDKSLDLSMTQQRFNRSSTGFADAKLFARYTLLQQDKKSETFRIAGFAGVKFPSGKSDQTDGLGVLPTPLQSGSGAWDRFAGAVLTYQQLDYEFDAQISFDQKGRDHSFQLGNEKHADISFQYRLSPMQMTTDTHHFIYGVLEANWVDLESNQIASSVDENSGGQRLFLTPGIQYVTQKYILEAAIQLPVMQKLNPSELEIDYIFTTGFRVNF